MHVRIGFGISAFEVRGTSVPRASRSHLPSRALRSGDARLPVRRSLDQLGLAGERRLGRQTWARSAVRISASWPRPRSETSGVEATQDPRENFPQVIPPQGKDRISAPHADGLRGFVETAAGPLVLRFLHAPAPTGARDRRTTRDARTRRAGTREDSLWAFGRWSSGLQSGKLLHLGNALDVIRLVRLSCRWRSKLPKGVSFSGSPCSMGRVVS